MKSIYHVEYAGHKVRYSFLFPATKFYFREFIRRSEGEEYDIRVNEDLVELGRKYLPEDSSDGYVEYRLMIERTALELLRWDCSIFHSAAFTYLGRAWLLAASSGTGKTTQFLNWQRLFPNEVEMICGDMPVIEPREDGSVWVHATSWCGKESFGKKGLCAPLGGIVILEQGKTNEIRAVERSDAIMPFFRQFILRPETEDQVLALCRLMERMLCSAPVWRMVNLGDDDSTRMLRRLLTAAAQEGDAHEEV